MSNAPTINWTGSSGKTYQYYIYPISNFSFRAEGGNYIFAKQNPDGSFSPIYIGETSNLNERFDNHHKMNCINRNSATHIHAHINNNHKHRLDEETDLVREWNTPCNG